MRIKADVTTVTGKTKHYSGTSSDNRNTGPEIIQSPKWVEISEEQDGFYLYHYNSDGKCIADTWHETLKDAKEQAKFEFNISDDEWSQVG